MYTARLRADKMAALKEKDAVKNKIVTMLMSGITYKKKELGRDLTEQECLDVISKELKQEKEALDMAAGREDKIAELQAEIAILESYLPKQLSAEEVAEKVAALIEAADKINKNRRAAKGKSQKGYGNAEVMEMISG